MRAAFSLTQAAADRRCGRRSCRGSWRRRRPFAARLRAPATPRGSPISQSRQRRLDRNLVCKPPMPSALIAGPYSMHPLLGGTRHAQLPTGVLLRAGLSPAVKVLDLKERLRYRRCGRKWRAVVSVKWWGQGQRAAPRPRGWAPSLCVRKNGRALPVKTRLAGLYGGPGTESLLTLCWRGQSAANSSLKRGWTAGKLSHDSRVFMDDDGSVKAPFHAQIRQQFCLCLAQPVVLLRP